MDIENLTLKIETQKKTNNNKFKGYYINIFKLI